MTRIADPMTSQKDAAVKAVPGVSGEMGNAGRANIHEAMEALADGTFYEDYDRAYERLGAIRAALSAALPLASVEQDLEVRAEGAEALVRSARDVFVRLTAHAPGIGVDEFLDAINDARDLVARIDGAE